MRKILTICYLCLILSFALPLFPGRPEDASPEGAETSPVLHFPAPCGPVVSLLREGEILELPLEEYLLGVVAAEMPASFPEEALRAQAVAARTYTLYCASRSRHSQAQLCCDPGCCQAWIDRKEMDRRWGTEAALYRGRIEKALLDTAGEYLSYEGEAICAAFHSCSAGFTEASGSIWSPTPYLVSVASPETVERVPELESYVWLSPADFAAALENTCPGLALGDDPGAWLGSLRRSEGGRVDSLTIGGHEFSGAELRAVFSLRSTDFELCYDGTGFAFLVSGYGHGLGMSQYGAGLMAEDGADYREILLHYYPGTSLVT